ncbi:obg-like ATPase 1 [Camellia sinensis]|uniref:obg-like ATPase 1 n=1 Tax=Camellia sinensis TaxID=4442 RepID=UPI0010358DAA|nr:obg-like ATPase 1 [Camellia sinensis]
MNVTVLTSFFFFFFFAGEMLANSTADKGSSGCWTHTDFEKGSICAEVMKFEDLKELGSEPAVKAAGKYRQEGKNMRGPRRRCHIVQVQCFS